MHLNIYLYPLIQDLIHFIVSAKSKSSIKFLFIVDTEFKRMQFRIVYYL